MRALPDRKLPEPYRTWIDRSTPLPSGVRLLPRTVNPRWDSILFGLFGAMFGGMSFLLVAVPPWRFDPAKEGWLPYLILAAVCGALLLVPISLLRRLGTTFGAYRDLKRGVLRQGILVGPDGLLVRLAPHRCHAVPWNRFVVARLFPPEKSKSTRDRSVIIETLDGPIEFPMDRLAATTDQINRGASEHSPSWSRPKPIERADRALRTDHMTSKQLGYAAAFFGVAILIVLGSLAAIIAVGDKSPAAPICALALLLGLALTAVSVVCLVYRFARLQRFYRCPACARKPTQVLEALPAIHYYCAACNVEWDTKTSEREGD